MAIIKTANGHGKYRDLRTRNDLITYITDPQKAQSGHIFYSMTNPHSPVEDMNRVAEQFGKADGVQARHFIFSFRCNEVNSLVAASCIAQDITRYLGREFQAVSAVHENTPELHIHTVINSVSYLDGHRYYGTKAEFYRMKNGILHILQDYGVRRLDYVSS